MCGICAGTVGECAVGDLIVPDRSQNHQAGRLNDGKLQPELVQVQIPPDTSVKPAQLAADETHSWLRNGLLNSELAASSIHMQAMVSGSIVVADDTIAAGIGGQSRKIAGLDL